MVKRSTHPVQHEIDSRTVFDAEYCTNAKGYARILTTRDAWYFGQWINAARRQIVRYTEGDLDVIDCDTDEELKAEVGRIATFHADDGNWLGIEAAAGDLRQSCIAAGLGEYLQGGNSQSAATAANTRVNTRTARGRMEVRL